MNSHNAKTESVVKNVSVQITAEPEDPRVIASNLVELADLAISEDDDKGSDPYNSTGQHVIIKSRLISED